MIDIISVSLSAVISLEPPNLLPLRKFMIPCQKVADQPTKIRQRRLRFRENISGYVSIVLYGGSGVRWPARPKEPFLGKLS